jgi:Leucine-rich repeat (LRR) protein
VLGGSQVAASVNMSKNRALKRSDFLVSEINLQGLTELERLYISMQLLEEMDLKHTPKLKLLWCESNSLARVNLAGCQNLEEISVRNNFLEEIDLSNLPALKTLHCNSNRLSNLDITLLQNLETLRYDVGETHLIQRPDQHF